MIFILYEYINEYRIKPVDKNGFIEVDGRRVGISNLPKYLEEHPDIAVANRYYECVEDAMPEHDENTQYVVNRYVIEDGHIKLHYEVHEIVIPEEVIK